MTHYEGYSVERDAKRCEPAYVKEIAEAAAQVKRCTLEVLKSGVIQALSFPSVPSVPSVPLEPAL